MNADLLRVVAFILYFIILGQTFAIVWGSFRWRRQAKANGIKESSLFLPYQVIVLGVLLFVADSAAVWQNYVRLGEGFSSYTIVNPILFSAINVALYLVIRRRFAVQRLDK